MRIPKSNFLPFSFSLFLEMDLIFLAPQCNCNLKSVWCKYCYCWRHNQTFMRERDLGRSTERESRSRMHWQVSETAASLSVLLNLSFTPPPPSILSFVFLCFFVAFIFCPLIPLKLLFSYILSFLFETQNVNV